MVNGRRAGKELCDLLVVCGNEVIVFSIKAVRWNHDKDINIAWPRWYNRAIAKSVLQIRRAEQWIKYFPDRIFIDPHCMQKLPIPIPPSGTRKIHGVIVALGAHDACSEFFAGDSGSFIIAPHLLGDSHGDPDSPGYSPFTIGDLDPSGSFIHVVNDVTLDIVMRELDTITDFTEYLERKVEFVRSGRLISAAGEEDLLAYYITHLDKDNQHGFVHPDNRPWQPNEHIVLDQGFYSGMISNPQYIAKKQADRNSYIWDRLIEAFTDHMLAGTTIVPDGGPLEIPKLELGVRCMAQEPRVKRRMLGAGLIGLLQIAHRQDRSFRTMLPPPENPDNALGYVFLTLALPKDTLPGGYDQYRQARSNMLYAYCMLVLHKYRHLKHSIGIATEAPPTLGRSASSEDMVMVKSPPEWTQELVAELERMRNHFDIMREDRINLLNFHVEEYPKTT